MFRRRTDPDEAAGRLMQWAWQTAAAVDWSRWRPHPGDRLIAYGAPPFGVPPPTQWLVLDYSKLVEADRKRPDEDGAQPARRRLLTAATGRLRRHAAG
jgi:hypothetical protein